MMYIYTNYPLTKAWHELIRISILNKAQCTEIKNLITADTISVVMVTFFLMDINKST